MNETAAREEIMALMREMEARPIHVQHVARLSARLFDGLAPLHGLGGRERLLLEAASMLHDIGHQYDYTGVGHHKESARMIRQHRWEHLGQAEVEILAQVTRYHRRSMPDFKHEEFRALPDSDRRIVQCLAGLLRVGDSLDRAHEQAVKDVQVELRPNQIALHLAATGSILREVKAARAKSDLAALVFQRSLIFLSEGREVQIPAGSAGEMG